MVTEADAVACVAPTLPARTKAGGGMGTDFDCDGGLLAYGGNNTTGPISVSSALSAHGGSGRMDFESETFVAHTLRAKDCMAHREDVYTLVAHTLRGDGFDASEDGTGRGTPLVPVAFALRGREGGALRACNGGSSRDYLAFDTAQITSAANRSNPQAGDPCHPLAAGAHPPAVAFQSSQSGVRLDQVHATLDACNGTLHGMQVRRLTPRECERLQGFPADYTLVPHRGKPAADGPRYKALGNSWACNVARWVGQRIQMVEQIERIAA